MPDNNNTLHYIFHHFYRKGETELSTDSNANYLTSARQVCSVDAQKKSTQTPNHTTFG